VWVRKGVEARRTRSQSRIVRLQQLRARRAERRDVLGRVNMDIASGQGSGKIVAELTEVSKSVPGRGRGASAPWCATSAPPSCAATRWAWSAPTAPARPRCSN
jgi:hypothetical protein